MIRYTSLRQYRRDLIKELGPLDEEILCDAIDDSEEHLFFMVKDIMKKEKHISKRKAIAKAVETFGDPSEIAEAYRMTL